jgi:hypothetical protein
MSHKYYDSSVHEHAQNEKIKAAKRHETKEDAEQKVDEAKQDATLKSIGDRVTALEAISPTQDSALAARVTKLESDEASEPAEHDAMVARIQALEDGETGDVTTVQFTALGDRVSTLEQTGTPGSAALLDRVIVLESKQPNIDAITARLTALESTTPSDQKLNAFALTVTDRFTAMSKRIDELIVAPGIVK